MYYNITPKLTISTEIEFSLQYRKGESTFFGTDGNIFTDNGYYYGLDTHLTVPLILSYRFGSDHSFLVGAGGFINGPIDDNFENRFYVSADGAQIYGALLNLKKNFKLSNNDIYVMFRVKQFLSVSDKYYQNYTDLFLGFGFNL